MTRQEILLTILGEECNEVAQRVSKALRFGLDEVQEGQNLTNSERILQEFMDLSGVLDMLLDERVLKMPSDDMVDFQTKTKKLKVEKYLKYSKEVGRLTE